MKHIPLHMTVHLHTRRESLSAYVAGTCALFQLCSSARAFGYSCAQWCVLPQPGDVCRRGRCLCVCVRDQAHMARVSLYFRVTHACLSGQISAAH